MRTRPMGERLYFHGEFTDPFVEYRLLIGGCIDKRNAHAHWLLSINDLARTGENALVSNDADLYECAHRQSVHNIDEAPFAADFRNPSGNSHIRKGFGDFDGRDETVTWHGPLFRKGGRRFTWRFWEGAHVLFS